MPFELARLLPVGHYARKNLAYLAAIKQGATCIYETDDDNAPNESWVVRSEEVEECRVVSSAENRWVNVYRYFSVENVWPRGLPLDEIRNVVPDTARDLSAKRAPIQQGLVNGSADVDAIWRLVMDREFFSSPERACIWNRGIGAPSIPKQLGGGRWFIRCFTSQVTAPSACATFGKVSWPCGNDRSDTVFLFGSPLHDIALGAGWLSALLSGIE